MKSNLTAINYHSESGCCANHDKASSVVKEDTSNASFEPAAEAMLHITGMRCGGCAAKVRTALTNADGVIDAQVRFAESSAKVRYEPQRTDVETICSVLDSAGYSTHGSGLESSSSEFTLPAGWLKHRMVWAVAAASGVIGFYLGLITLTSDWSNTAYQFSEFGGWVIALALGLGIQVGLFTHMRAVMAGARLKGAASGMAASGGASGVAMALCCSHYLAAILPAIGLPFFSGAVAGLVEYQTVFFVIGVISNMLGIAYMLRLMVKNGIFAYGAAYQ